MIGWAYLATLLVSIGSMALIDRRWRVFLWADPRRGAVLLVVGLVFFLAWDVVAISSQIYRRGASAAMTDIELLPELPLEELFFIVFLCYLTMVVHGLIGHVADRRGR